MRAWSYLNLKNIDLNVQIMSHVWQTDTWELEVTAALTTVMVVVEIFAIYRK